MGASACRKAPNASLLPDYLSPAQVKIEMTKWQNAFEFSNATKHLDIAYDGIFSQRANLQFCELMKASKPDWVFVDDEAFGEGWNTWKFEAGLSANAKARAMPREKPLDLAWRMASEMMKEYTGCLAQVAPATNVHWQAPPRAPPRRGPHTESGGPSHLAAPARPVCSPSRVMLISVLCPLSSALLFVQVRLWANVSIPRRDLRGCRHQHGPLRVRAASLPFQFCGRAPTGQAVADTDGGWQAAAPFTVAYGLHM